MNASRAARILLARSVEETAPELFTDDAILEATLGAGQLDDPADWFSRRAERLVESLPLSYRGLSQMTDALAGSFGPILVASAMLGLLTNYLGPSQRIHAVYNPIVLLVAWNLVIYVALAVGRLRSPRRYFPFRGPRAEDTDSSGPARSTRSESARRTGRGPSVLTRWMFRQLVPTLWVRFHGATGERKRDATLLGAVAKTYWSHWTGIAHPLFSSSARRQLSVAAIGLALGAIAGMFVRGLFLDYHIVWRSTFVTHPDTVAGVLRALFWLPALLARQVLPDSQSAAALLEPDGVAAQSWIWIYAYATGLFILVPRGAMAAAYSLRLRSLGAGLDVRLDAPYYQGILRRAKEQHVNGIADAIKTDVRVESSKFAEGVATWVCEKLYDQRIAPRLKSFRQDGGRLRDLEGDIASECRSFQSELDEYFPRAQSQFEQSLSRAVASTLEADVPFEAKSTSNLGDEVRGASSDAAVDVSQSIGRGLSRVAGSTVSGTVALVAGTVSGGFGKTLGAAVVATLLGTTGPVGFLIGALAGFVAAGGAYFLGRQRAAAAIKSIRLPASAVRAVFRPSRLEKLVSDGRLQCHEAVRRLINEKLEPLTPEISDQIWTKVRPLLAGRQRGALVEP